MAEGTEKALIGLFDTGKQQGLEEGRREIRTKVLDFLEEEYLKKSVHRGSPYGAEILTLAGQLSELMTVDE